jgi:hypothetical protein
MKELSATIRVMGRHAIRWTMTTQKPRFGTQLAIPSKSQPAVDKYPARRFPIQHEIQNLENALNVFNERIVELEKDGHRGYAVEVLKVNAIDLARQIDELRCLLIEPVKSGGLRKFGPNRLRAT